jgi:predicted HTH domain antitoxin
MRQVNALRIEFSPDLRDALRVPPEEQEARLRRELAVRLYQKGLLSFGKARQLAGLSKWAFHELLAAEGIVRHYDAEELQADLATLETLG